LCQSRSPFITTVTDWSAVLRDGLALAVAVAVGVLAVALGDADVDAGTDAGADAVCVADGSSEERGVKAVRLAAGDEAEADADVAWVVLGGADEGVLVGPGWPQAATNEPAMIRLAAATCLGLISNDSVKTQ
jgi:DNA-binding NarL/FixJ family response regulator